MCRQYAYFPILIPVFKRICLKISNSPLYPMEKPKTSNIWKKSDLRAKRSEIWDSRGVLQYSHEVVWGDLTL